MKYAFEMFVGRAVETRCFLGSNGRRSRSKVFNKQISDLETMFVVLNVRGGGLGM